MSLEDTHRDLRAAVAAALRLALDAAEVDVAVTEQDTPDPNMVDLPAVIVSYGGAEQDRGGTNARDDYAFPMLLGLYTLKADPDTDVPANEPPGLRPTAFRTLVRRTFHHRRVVVEPSGLSLFPTEYDPTPPVNDDGGPEEIQQLRTAVGVTVPARLPRGD